MNEEDAIDLSWAHPALAKSAGKIFRNVRRDELGRFNLSDMRIRFGRHGVAMLDEPEYEKGQAWAFLSDKWQSVLKDWAMNVGLSPYCIKEG